jgi:NMD protein affecting ribosome stability and mRNA decay
MAELPEDRRKKYLKRKKSGFCPRCGKKKSKREKFSYCDDCRQYYRDYGSEIADKVNKKRKSNYKARKKNHQCPRCGEKLAKSYTKTMCAKCLKKARQQQTSV